MYKIKRNWQKQIRDEAEFQHIINTYIYENLIVNYRILNIDGKKYSCNSNTSN